MNFKLKTLLAALALTAATVPAQAALSLTSTGNSSFILSVWNADLGSATFDLGYTYSNIAGLVNQGTFNMATGNYASAWSTISATSSAPTYWAIFAGDNTGSGAGSRGIYTTANSLAGMEDFATNTVLTTALGNMNTYMIAANGQGNHAAVNDGANTSTLTANSGAGSGIAYGTVLKTGLVGPVAAVSLGESQQMLQILTAATGGTPTASFIGTLGNNYTFNLSSAGMLTVSAVPEADTNAMLMVGLGMIGFIARRRKA